jgi:hypothetical protein
MEYTITLPDSPSAIACGSDGSFLNLFGELEREPLVAPQFSVGSPACHHTQGAEGKSSACPHREACYQTLGEWYMRHGQYQRPDVTGYDRLDTLGGFLFSSSPVCQAQFRVSSGCCPAGRCFLNESPRPRPHPAKKRNGCAGV